MGTVQQAVITPRMSSTLGSTAGCALTTRRWRSSTSTSCWSRLQSVPPTCCTTAVSTCCRHAHKRTSRHTRRKYLNIFTDAHEHTCSKCTWHESTSTHDTHTHQTNEQEHCPTCSLARFFLFFPSCPCFPENQLFQRLFLVSFWKKRNKLHSQRVLCDCSPLCTTAVFLSVLDLLLKRQGWTVE